MSDQQPVPPPCAPVGAIVGRVVRFTVSKEFEGKAPRTELGHLSGVTDTHGTFEVIRMGLLDAGIQDRVLPWDKLDFETVEGQGLGGLYAQYFVESRYLSGGRVRTLYNLARARERRNRELLRDCLRQLNKEEAGWFRSAFDLVCHNAMDAFRIPTGNAPPFGWAAAFNWRASAKGDEVAELQESILDRFKDHPHLFAELTLAHLDEVCGQSDEYAKSAMVLVCAWQLLGMRPDAKASELSLRLLDHALRLDTQAFDRLPLFWAGQVPFPGTEQVHATRTRMSIIAKLMEGEWGLILRSLLRPGPFLEKARPTLEAVGITEARLREVMLAGWANAREFSLRMFAPLDRNAGPQELRFNQEERRVAFQLLCDRLRRDPSLFASKDHFWGYWKDFSEEERESLKVVLTTQLSADPVFFEAVRKLGRLLPDEILPLLGTAPDAPVSDR